MNISFIINIPKYLYNVIERFYKYCMNCCGTDNTVILNSICWSCICFLDIHLLECAKIIDKSETVNFV